MRTYDPFRRKNEANLCCAMRETYQSQNSSGSDLGICAVTRPRHGAISKAKTPRSLADGFSTSTATCNYCIGKPASAHKQDA
jgi:hypothetical protein